VPFVASIIGEGGSVGAIVEQQFSEREQRRDWTRRMENPAPL
jgi:hypothetical protein